MDVVEYFCTCGQTSQFLPRRATAIKLKAERIVVISSHATTYPESSAAASRPQIIDIGAQAIQGQFELGRQYAKRELAQLPRLASQLQHADAKE